MFVVVSWTAYIGWTIGKYIGKAILGVLWLAGLMLIALMKAAGKFLSLLFKYTPIMTSWSYAKVCQFCENHKMRESNIRTLAP